ncbi:hypothetical protein PR240_02485 [Metamycoplasma hyosynoviae]|uniref:hypothetical protein n=1 Tax=Metamycoplasma hyosynoviae TaxID=29559 RepID=UPI00235A00B3|nr:hypothetical protein [Metamycoplasma hyosynoviae]MDC8916573.1 hypothetical protein [Metamycoplasma hyosynoviae]
MIKKNKFIILGLVCNVPIITSFFVSCKIAKKPAWKLNKNYSFYNKNFINAQFDDDNIQAEDESNLKIIGNYQNSYNISREQLLEIFSSFNLKLTDYGKSFTSTEMFEKLREIVGKKVIVPGKYFQSLAAGRKTFEELMKNDPELTKIFTGTLPDITKFNNYYSVSNFWEIRYQFLPPSNEKQSFLWLRATFYHTDNTHIDRSISENVHTNRHDVGVPVGPAFYCKIDGFKTK